MRLPFGGFALPGVMLGALLLPGFAYGQWTIGWSRQFSAPATYAMGVSATTDGVYVAGYTGGALPGQTNSGNFDVFVAKYDHDGNVLWIRQFGSANADHAGGVSATADGVYVAGTTYGALPGQTQVGNEDAFVRKYDPNGNELWTRQFGSAAYDAAGGVSAAADGVYVVGETEGALPGQTRSGDFDAFVRKYDLNGNEVWTRQFGQNCGAPINTTGAAGVDAAPGGLYIAGHSTCGLGGQTNTGGFDAFVRKYDSTGNELWTREFGSPSDDEAYCVSVGAAGVFVGGRTSGALPGQTQSQMSSFDAFVRAYDADGHELWTHQFGSVNNSGTGGVAAGAEGVLAAWYAGLSQYDSNGNAINLALFASLRPNAVDAWYGRVYVTGGYLGNDALLAMLVAPGPLIVPQITGTPGNHGWYRSNVTVSWSVTDTISGITSSSGCGPVMLTVDTPGATLTCTATNGAGQTASVPVTIRIDRTPPVISGMPGGGCTVWPPNGKMVSVAVVTAADAISGVAPGGFQVTGASSDPGGSNDILITPDGRGGFVVQVRADKGGTAGRVYTLSAAATDVAGNTANASTKCTVPHDQGR